MGFTVFYYLVVGTDLHIAISQEWCCFQKHVSGFRTCYVSFLKLLLLLDRNCLSYGVKSVDIRILEQEVHLHVVTCT